MGEKVLEIKNLSFSYGDKFAAEDVSIDVEKGEFVGLIGPNGSGKSTVLKNVYRALRPDSGEILLKGTDLLSMPFKESALQMAVVGQENDVPFNFKVEEIVAMGRTPHKKMFEIDTKEDKAIVRHALEHLGMEDMAKRNYLNLSGGEKQRVIIASPRTSWTSVISCRSSILSAGSESRCLPRSTTSIWQRSTVTASMSSKTGASSCRGPRKRC